MHLRKLRADKIFTGTHFIQDHVLVTDEAGKVHDLVPFSEAGNDVEAFEGILSPGFVNCHCHLELSHMKAKIPEKTGLVDFVFKVVTERQAADEEILQAIERAEDEMIAGGIVAVGDICNNNSTLTQKKKKRLRYYNFIEASGWLPAIAQNRWERALELAGKFAAGNNKTSIVPHAPYSVSNNLWKKLEGHFPHHVVSIHNQETAHEDDFFRSGTGDFNRMYAMMQIDNSHHLPTEKSSLQSYFHHLESAASILLVHNSFTGKDDVDYVHDQMSAGASPDTYFCLCINANRYIEEVCPPVEMLRASNCSIVIGTDSLASNWSLSMADEMKTIRRYFPAIPLHEILQWATINGARALQFDEVLGSFENGKSPGVILIDENLEKVQPLIPASAHDLL